MPLALRRGVVASVESRREAVAELVVTADGERRPAIAYRDLTGEVEPGDDVVVNTVGVGLELGSGGFNILHANLTRGLRTRVDPAARTLKLNYTSLQHGVVPAEELGGGTGAHERDREGEAKPRAPRLDGRPVAVIALHGQLEAVAWAAAERCAWARVGFVQSSGGALPGGLSHAVPELRRRGLLAGHVTAAPAFGGEREAITVAGALAAGFTSLGWDGAIVGPGPGIVGSASALGHGGLAALDSAHAGLSLGARTVIVPRMSTADPRERHRGLSHHSATVLELLLRPAAVAFPAEAPRELTRTEALARHELVAVPTDLDGYRAAGLSSRSMGRSLDEDELFFRAALAGGSVLAAEIQDQEGQGGSV